MPEESEQVSYEANDGLFVCPGGPKTFAIRSSITETKKIEQRLATWRVIVNVLWIGLIVRLPSAYTWGFPKPNR